MLFDARRGALSSALLSLSPLLLMLTSPTSAQISTSNTACTKHYVVQAGDTCDNIGQKTLTSTYQIMSLNLPQAGSDCYTLQIGVQLCLGTYGNDCQLVHRVFNGDTCGSIESQYGLTRETLLSNNPMLTCDGLYNGMVLCVTQGIIRPPADPSLNVSYNPQSPGFTNENAVMPLGVAIEAINAAFVEPAVVEVVTAASGSSSSSTVLSSSSTKSATEKATGTAAAAAAKHKAYVKNHHHNAQHHKARDSGHSEAAKRYQMDHDAAQVS